MQKILITEETTINRDDFSIGETIEDMAARITKNNEPIKDSVPMIYQERRDGINPSYDIRTDRFEIAINATDIIAKSKIAQREIRPNIENDDATADENSAA